MCNYQEISDVKFDNSKEAISDVDINNVNYAISDIDIKNVYHVNMGIKHSVLLSTRVDLLYQ